jgi:hypothetical protein
VKVTPGLLAALDYLWPTPEMRHFRDSLKTAAREAAEFAVKSNENVDVNRGRAQALLELSDLLETAPEQRKRLETRNGKATNARGGPGGG